MAIILFDRAVPEELLPPTPCVSTWRSKKDSFPRWEIEVVRGRCSEVIDINGPHAFRRVPSDVHEVSINTKSVYAVLTAAAWAVHLKGEFSQERERRFNACWFASGQPAVTSESEASQLCEVAFGEGPSELSAQAAAFRRYLEWICAHHDSPGAMHAMQVQEYIKFGTPRDPVIYIGK